MLEVPRLLRENGGWLGKHWNSDIVAVSPANKCVGTFVGIEKIATAEMRLETNSYALSSMAPIPPFLVFHSQSFQWKSAEIACRNMRLCHTLSSADCRQIWGAFGGSCVPAAQEKPNQMLLFFQLAKAATKAATM